MCVCVINTDLTVSVYPVRSYLWYHLSLTTHGLLVCCLSTELSGPNCTKCGNDLEPSLMHHMFILDFRKVYIIWNNCEGVENGVCHYYCGQSAVTGCTLLLTAAAATTSYDNLPSSAVTVHWLCQDTSPSPCLCVQSAGLLQCTTVWHICRAAASHTICPERCCVIQGRCPGGIQCLSGNAPTYLTDNWHQHAPTQLDRHGGVCCSTVSHTTTSAIGVSQWLDHACGTHYLLRYDNVTVSEI